MLIATGSGETKDTEVLDLTSGMTCDPLPDFPYEVVSAVGGTVGEDKTVIICGGFNEPSKIFSQTVLF